MSNIRIKDLPAFSGTLSSDAMFAMETNAATKKVSLGTLRSQIAPVGTKQIDANGTYDAADDDLYGFNQVEVDVPNTYTIEDEGLVVHDQELTEQGSMEVWTNETYDTTYESEVSVDVTPNSATALAKLGGSSEIVEVNGLYGPMGDASDDFITPIANATQTEVTLNTAQPYEIRVVFRLTQYPSSNAIIFGAANNTDWMPHMTVKANGADISASMPYVSEQYGATDFNLWLLPSGADPLPLNKDIAVWFKYDGTNVTARMQVAGETGYSAQFNTTTYPPYTQTGVITIGKQGRYGTTGGLAGVSGSYINISACYIKQGSATLWRPSGMGNIRLGSATFTDNGNYTPQDVDGWDDVIVDVQPPLQQKSVSVNGDVTPDAGYYGLSKVTVAVSTVEGALAKLGSDANIIELNGLYGPMGDANDDYITPISTSTQLPVSIDTSTAFEIKVTFVLTALPSTRVALFGELNNADNLPEVVIAAGGTNIEVSMPYTNQSQQMGHVSADIISNSSYVLPLNKEITVTLAYDGTDVTATSQASGESAYSHTISGSNHPLWPEEGPIAIAREAHYEYCAGLASVAGSYINIQKCSIKQGATILWMARNPTVIEPLTVTVNGTYPLTAGVDGFGPVVVAVPTGGDRCPRSEQTTSYQMNDFYGIFTFAATAEEET